MSNLRPVLSTLLTLLTLLMIVRTGLCLEITLQESAEVSGEVITLGDIARFSPEGEEASAWAARPITGSPVPGGEKVLQAHVVASALRNLEGTENLTWNGAEAIVVHRRGVRMDLDRLKTIIAEYLQNNLDRLPDADIRLTSVRAPENIMLPLGRLSWRVTPSRPEIIGSNSFTIDFSVDGKPVKSCTVRGRLEVIAEVATAAVNIRRGTIITPDQLVLERQDISRLDHPFADTTLATGLLAKRTIRAGRPLDGKNTEEPPVIHKGEPVKIFAVAGALRVSTRGVAIMNGRMGDYIRVKNISSNKLVYCRVDGPGQVSVEF